MKPRSSVRGLVAMLWAFGPLALISCTSGDMVSAPSSPASSQSGSQPTRDEAPETDAFSIGQSYGGGIIFWIDETGQDGLIAATSDQGFIWWGDRSYPTSGATGTAVGTGFANTQAIIGTQGHDYTYAALLCADYRGGGFDDWFLPSKDELYLLYQHEDVVGDFVRGGYWSSSEFDHSLAWQKYFYNDLATCSHKDRYDGVRAIRAFSTRTTGVPAGIQQPREERR